MPLRRPLALPKMSKQASVATRLAGGVLQPFPLALHPSKLSPHFQQIRVSCVSRPHTEPPCGLGKPSPPGRPVRCSATGCRTPRTLPSRRWLQATLRSVTPQAEWRGALSVPFPRPQGLDPSVSPLRPPALQLNGRPMLPWASPLKGLLHRRRVAAGLGERETEASTLDTKMPCLTVPTKSCGQWAEARAAGEPAAVRDRADQPPSVQCLQRQAASDPADPTNTCSRRSAAPEGMAPDATSSGLPSSFSHGDRACPSRQ